MNQWLWVVFSLPAYSEMNQAATLPNNIAWKTNSHPFTLICTIQNLFCYVLFIIQYNLKYMYLLSSLQSNLLLSSTSGKEHHGSTNPASNVLESVAARPTKISQKSEFSANNLSDLLQSNLRIATHKCNTYDTCIQLSLHMLCN